MRCTAEELNQATIMCHIFATVEGQVPGYVLQTILIIHNHRIPGSLSPKVAFT
jgi:hypothetical protein